jgi:hypothetical protein
MKSTGKVGRTVTLRVPFALRKRGGRRLILAPAAPPHGRLRPRVDGTLVKTIARAYRWKRLLESGRFASVSELARAENINQSYPCRVLRLTLLAPEIIEAILDGRQSAALQTDALLKPLPPDWKIQRLALGL